jgi:Peptidase family M48
MPHARSLRLDIRLALGLMLAFAAGPASASEPAADSAAVAAPRVQQLVDAMRQAMAVDHDVAVELVPDNPLKASVEPIKDAAGSFRLAIEQRFLDQLSEDELKAVIAHELGHVWIYTHFPYLQTEQLANQIAMRVVSRDSLDRVYGKVWADAASAGPLPRFPEERAVAADLGAPRPEN